MRQLLWEACLSALIQVLGVTTALSPVFLPHAQGHEWVCRGGLATGRIHTVLPSVLWLHALVEAPNPRSWLPGPPGSLCLDSPHLSSDLRAEAAGLAYGSTVLIPGGSG